MTTTYRDLTPFPVAAALRVLHGGEPAVIVTMSEGQWDALLSAAYAHGFILLELDDDEQPVRAFQRKSAE
jgi:hypothetical protein